MTTFFALVVLLGFIHVAMLTYVRHAGTPAVRRLWASPYRYDAFRPTDPCS